MNISVLFLLCSLPDSWDNMVVAVGSITQSTLKFEDVVASSLSKVLRRKSMKNHTTNSLSVSLGGTLKWKKSTRGRSKSKSWGDTLKTFCGKSSKLGHF